MKSMLPLLHLPHHLVGEVKRPTPTTGLRRQLLQAPDQFFLRRLFLEARGAGTGLPGAMGKVPHIRQVRMHGHKLAQLTRL
jgi:hypothetical protein